MKSKTYIKSNVTKFIGAFVLFLMAVNAFAQSFDPDDLPPEFGLGDDPEPGASIDFYIPVVITIMLVKLLLYFQKRIEKKGSNS